MVLDLCGHWIGDEGVREITVQKESRALRWLGLAHNGLRADAVRYLCDSPHLALNYLNVQGNNLTSEREGSAPAPLPGCGDRELIGAVGTGAGEVARTISHELPLIE